MAAEPQILTLEEIDALIDMGQSSRALLIKHWEWFVIRDAPRDLKVRNNGGLIYRGLNVWITGQNRVATEDECRWLDDI